MSLYEYLQLQPLEEPLEDGTLSELDTHKVDEEIILTDYDDGEELVERWTEIFGDMHKNDTTS